MDPRRSRAPLRARLLTGLLLGVPTASLVAQDTTLNAAIWSFPTLRSLRTAVTADTLLAPAFEACPEAAFMAEVTATLTGYRFRPALDRFGQAVSSMYTMTYRFGRDAQPR